MKYFKHGNFLYGFVYTFWRGWRHIKGLLATCFYRATISCGINVSFGSNVCITYPKNITIGSNCLIANGVMLTSESENGRLIINDHVQLSDGVRVDFSGSIEIEAGVLISPGAMIHSHSHGHHPRSDPVSSPLRIGENVWIGVDAIIMPRVSIIGKGAIIGVRSIVTRDVMPNAIVAGSPARQIGSREEASGN